MTGLRDWAEEGATPEELALLAAARREEAPAGARSRALAALGVGAVITAATSTTTSAAATTIAGTTFKLVAKIALAVVVAGGASGLAWHAVRTPASIATKSRSPVVAVPSHVKETPSLEAPPSVEAPPVDAPATVPDVAHAVASSRPLRVHPSPSASSDTLVRQVAALEKAHAALAAHDPKAALRALDRYRSKFPDGTLSSEEKVLRVQAALAQGDKERAAALANELRAANPDSPYARRVGDLVSQDKTPKPAP